MKEKLLKSIIILFAFAALQISCENESDTGQQKQVTLDFPDSWSVQENVNNSVVLLGQSPLDGEDDDFRENVNIAVERTGHISQDEYYNANIKALETFYNFEVLSSTDTTLNGYNAKKFIFTAVTNSLPVKVLDYLIVEDQHGYVITCMALQDTFAGFKPTFEEIAGSFNFVE